MKQLRPIRILLQLAILLFVTWCLLATPSVVVMACRGVVERWMLVPMTMIGAMSVVGVWLAVSLLFGRIYCSTMCPVGTMQDIVARALRLFVKRPPYRYRSSSHWYVRVAMIAILVMALSFSSLAVSWSLLPFLQVSPLDTYNDILVTVSDPLLHRLQLSAASVATPLRIAISAIVNLVFILAMGAFYGRDLCNMLCPLGGAFGVINQLALFHCDIDTDLCIHCRRCDDVCKCSCVDSDHGIVDLSRCVVCFDCVAVCPNKAMKYTSRRHRLSIPMLMKIKSLTLDKPKPAYDANVSDINNETPQ